MAYQDRAEEIAALVAALATAGRVHPRTRLVTSWADYIQEFVDANDRVNGFEITRTGAEPRAGRWVETYALRKFYGMDDDGASDFDFQQSLDDAVVLFREADLSFGLVYTTLRIVNAREGVFGNVLCHVGECELEVDMDEEVI